MKKAWLNNTIICVDDEESVRDTYLQILSPATNDSLVELFNLAGALGDDRCCRQPSKGEYRILLAPSGAAALRMITEEMDNGRRVAAGFFDMRMPGGMDGYETIEKVRQLDNDLICSVVTAYTDRDVLEIRSLFTDAHQDELHYIKKPFSVDELDQAALNMISAWNRKRQMEDHLRAIEKQRRGLRQILHAVSTFSRVPPHSLENLISGLLLQLLGIVEGEAGFAVVVPKHLSGRALSYGIGPYEHREDLVQTMNTMPAFEKAFDANQVLVDKGQCIIPFLSAENKMGGMYITSDKPIANYLDNELLEVFRNQMVNLVLNSIYHLEMVKKEQEALTDPLTGLYNRRFIIRRLKEELNRNQRGKSPITMMMIDIDDFKQVNDYFGHDAGDRILRSVGNLMRTAVRNDDLVGQRIKAIGQENEFAIRYGGEEFCLVLLDTASRGAIAVAERLRERIENHVFQYHGHHIRLTVSIGIYTDEFRRDIADQDRFLVEINKKADKALYHAKTTGKNRVIAYTSMQLPSEASQPDPVALSAGPH